MTGPLSLGMARPLTTKRMQGSALPTEGEAAATGAPVFRLFDASVDRHGDRIVGVLRTDNFEKNPVLYLEHDHMVGGLPIGTCRVWQEGGEWRMEPRVSEATEKAREAAALLADGTLRACSIGYATLDAKPNEFGGEDVLEAELVEVSLVGLPAYPNALRVKSMTEDDLKALRQMSADVAEMKALVTKLACPPPAAEDEAPPPEADKAKADEPPGSATDPAPAETEEPPASAEEPSSDEEDEEPSEVTTKFFRLFRVPAAAATR